ncbi:hypothetical protein GBZ48_13080 [Azospirillum melinis]|uniref:Uncharacterized protein n=1 Tax=Azospirillum melinis TaxID=328839 RepID=A0ABX2KFN8_9PROT|nr:hypothetical protein [Azospirillum melinis]MBP2306277.1 hypothetical protein [Azospirillum melinis]NUB00221.1 hypothetical protein [Azospirillum melinis]
MLMGFGRKIGSPTPNPEIEGRCIVYGDPPDLRQSGVVRSASKYQTFRGLHETIDFCAILGRNGQSAEQRLACLQPQHRSTGRPMPRTVHDVLLSMWQVQMHKHPAETLRVPLLQVEDILSHGERIFYDELLYTAKVERTTIKKVRVPPVFFEMVGKTRETITYRDLVVELDTALTDKIAIEFNPYMARY